MMKRLLPALTLLCLSSAYAQDVKIIKLKQKPFAFHPAHFRISSVKDERADTTNIGSMRAGIFKKLTTINLANGVTSALTRFINDNVKQDNDAQAVELGITELSISESAGIKERADMKLGIAFYIDGNKTTEYAGSAYAQTTLDASAYIEGMIRQGLESAFKEFDNWMEQNAEVTTPSPASVTVEVLRHADNEEQIFYSSDVPLKLEDFQGPPDDLSLGAAATYSGIAMRYTHQKNGLQLIIKAQVYASFDKTKSWCKPTGKNAKTLNHEQRHFDISALKCNELAKALKTYNFSRDNYIKEMDGLLRQYDKELSKMQQQYDVETKHGQNAAKQKQWDTDIKRKLTDAKI